MGEAAGGGGGGPSRERARHALPPPPPCTRTSSSTSRASASFFSGGVSCRRMVSHLPTTAWRGRGTGSVGNARARPPSSRAALPTPSHPPTLIRSSFFCFLGGRRASAGATPAGRPASTGGGLRKGLGSVERAPAPARRAASLVRAAHVPGRRRRPHSPLTFSSRPAAPPRRARRARARPSGGRRGRRRPGNGHDRDRGPTLGGGGRREGAALGRMWGHCRHPLSRGRGRAPAPALTLTSHAPPRSGQAGRVPRHRLPGVGQVVAHQHDSVPKGASPRRGHRERAGRNRHRLAPG